MNDVFLNNPILSSFLLVIIGVLLLFLGMNMERSDQDNYDLSKTFGVLMVGVLLIIVGGLRLIGWW